MVIGKYSHGFYINFSKKAALELLDWESRILTCILISIKIFHQRKTKIFSFLTAKPHLNPMFHDVQEDKITSSGNSFLISKCCKRKELLK